MLFIYGEERFLLKQRLADLRDSFIVENGEHSYEEFSTNDPLEKFIDSFSSMSLFCTKKMIVFEGLPKIRDGYEDHFQKLLAEQQTSHEIVFVYQGKPDKRKKFVKFLLKNSDSENFEPFSIWKKNDVVSWVVNREKERSIQIGRSEADLLIDLVGTDLWSLESNLLKMETYILPEKTINKEVVSKIATTSEKSLLDMFEALRKKDKSLYSYIFGVKKQEEVIALLGGLSSHARLILLLKTADSNSVDSLAKKAGKNPFYLKNLVRDIRSWSFLEAKNFLSDLHQLDFSIKTGQMKPLAGLAMVLSRYV